MDVSTHPGKPNFLGIGAQKCATTWVHRVLLDHPQAAVSDLKELNFFSAAYDHGAQWYESHFEDKSGLAVGEISPSYFYDSAAPARAKAYNPDFKVILTVRDPLARAYSNHLHEIRIGHFRGTDLSFEAGIANNPMYLEQSLYAKHFRKWLTHFDRDRILVLIQEEIENDPVAQARKLYEFLGLNASHQSIFLFRRVNQSYEEKLKGMNKVLRTFGQVGRRIGAGTIINRLRRHPAINAVREANQRHLNEVVPPMSVQVRTDLQNILGTDARAFATLINRTDLPWPTLLDGSMQAAAKAKLG